MCRHPNPSGARGCWSASSRLVLTLIAGPTTWLLWPARPQNREPFEAALAALHRCTALEPDGAVASAVVVAALERVDRADRGRWVDPLDDLHRPYAARRMAELALLEDIRAGSLSRVDDVDYWSEWHDTAVRQARQTRPRPSNCTSSGPCPPVATRRTTSSGAVRPLSTRRAGRQRRGSIRRRVTAPTLVGPGQIAEQSGLSVQSVPQW